MMRSISANGREIRTVALTTFLTALTAMAGASMTVIAWSVSWGYAQRSLAKEVLEQMDKKVQAVEERFNDRLAAHYQVTDVIHQRLSERIGENRERIDRLEGRRR